MSRLIIFLLLSTVWHVSLAHPVDISLEVAVLERELLEKKQLPEVKFTPVKHAFNLEMRQPITWLKLTVLNNSDSDKSINLFNHFAYLSEDVALYHSSNLVDPLSSYSPSSQNYNAQFLANVWTNTIEVESKQSSIFYLRNQSTYNQMYKFSVQPEASFEEFIIKHNTLAIFILAALIVLAAYNLALYFYGESIYFLYFSLYLINGAIGLAYLYGVIFQFFEDYRSVLNWLNITAILVPAFLAAFTQSALAIKKYSSLANNLLSGIIFISLINLIIAMTSGIEKAMLLVPFSFFFSFVVILFISFKMAHQKHRLINIFFIAYIIYIVSMGLTILGLYGILPYYECQLYASGAGLIIQGILFSYLLQCRTKILELEVIKHKERQEELKRLVENDDLTKVANRRSFEKIAKATIKQSKLQHKRFSLMFIDIDAFKYINDNLGHQVGDKVLQHVANKIKERLRHSDIVARLGGDEFVVLLPDTHNRGNLRNLVTGVIEAIKLPVEGVDEPLEINCSVGISVYPTHATTLKGLVECADKAMYKVKKNGKNNWGIYSV